MKHLRITALIVSLTATLASQVHAEVTLPSIIDSHMVLQREQPIPIWGWADPDEDVSVTFAGKTEKATANKDGKWQVTFPAMDANAKPQSMTIKGTNTIKLDDILIGEVWIGSGQSNMEWSMRASADPQKNIAEAKHPNLRLFHVLRAKKPAPAKDCTGDWKACTPKSVPNFSAVLYYFGRKLHKDLDVPVGLINSSWGGTRIEPWTKQNGKGAVLYNGMIAPLEPFAMRGVIWYQGESNVFPKHGYKYYGMMKDLISGWRKQWNREFPFYFAQIAPWGRYAPGELPKLWEAQVASLNIPNTGMAVTTDIVDNINDIHPKNKLDVGERLALWALAKTYGKRGLLYSGPLYKGMKTEGSKIRLSFAHVGEGLKSRDGKALTEFKIAGKDGKFVKAEAVIDGNEVIVSAEGVTEPTQVEFGWHMRANPNLANSAGLPASPFRTKNWRGGTGEK